MKVTFAQSARKHRIGRGHVYWVLSTAIPRATTTHRGEDAWELVGPDDRGLVLEIVAVELPGDVFYVIHAKPVDLRS